MNAERMNKMESFTKREVIIKKTMDDTPSGKQECYEIVYVIYFGPFCQEAVLAKCWDSLLAESLAETTRDFMEKNRKRT